MDVKPEVLKKDDNRKLRLVQNLRMGETDFNQFTGLRNQLFIARENFAREESLTQVVIPTHDTNTWMNKSNWLTKAMT